VCTLAAPLVSRESHFDLAHRFSAAEGNVLAFPAAVAKRSPVIVIETIRGGSAPVRALIGALSL
jgi:hypothetical protein